MADQAYQSMHSYCSPNSLYLTAPWALQLYLSQEYICHVTQLVGQNPDRICMFNTHS